VPPEFVRAEDHLEVPLGTVLVDEEGREQVFVGWRRNRAGHEMVFVKPYQKNKFRSLEWVADEPFIYHASGLETLLRKFPGLKEFQHAEA
jgi:tRNA(Arg) A34 adenosine deaminase TadA